MRAADYVYTIGSGLHRSNDGWTRTLVAYSMFAFLMTPQALIWKIQFAFFAAATWTRIRDKGTEPMVDEIQILDTIFADEELSKLFTPETYHVIDYDQEYDTGFKHYFKEEYDTPVNRFFNVDSNTTHGQYQIGDVESGAYMTLHFKTLPYSNNKYNFTEPYLIYDLHGHVTHNGNVSRVDLINKQDSIKSKPIFVPWH